MKSVLFGACAAIVIAAAPAHAQSDKPVHFIIGGGMTTPNGPAPICWRRRGPFQCR